VSRQNSRDARWVADSRRPYTSGMPILARLTSPWLALALLLGPLTASALPEDNDQPIRITTDELLRDEKTGRMVYRGNVELVQGTIRITADRMTFYRVEREGDKIVAEGSPARMQQQPEADSALMRARGDIIEYYRFEERVHLRKNAQVEQDGSTMTGDVIDYFIEEQLVKAAVDESNPSGQVEVVIPPHKIEED